MLYPTELRERAERHNARLLGELPGRMRFAERVQALPHLGLGISTEYGAGTVPLVVRRARPDLVSFVEIGTDVARGFDEHALACIAERVPTTYHFLDLNLEEPEDLDEDWLTATLALSRAAGAAWWCGDAGMWHVGPRDHGHGTLLPPVLCASSLSAMVDAVIALRERSGMEVLPENPPAQVWVGDVDLLAYFGGLAERADCGLLLDVSHLAIARRAQGLSPTALLDLFPIERVVEVHVAGSAARAVNGRTLLVDDHGPHIADDTWAILETVLARAVSLRAVVVECERNPLPTVVALFEQVRERLRGREPRAEPGLVPAIEGSPVDHRRIQRTLFRMFVDPLFARGVHEHGPPDVDGPAAEWLRALDPAVVGADPARGQQLLGNVALEFVHTARAAPDLVAPFLHSPELHDAIASDRPLPLAFARYAARRLPPTGLARAMLTLDAAMASLRRLRVAHPQGPPALAPTCRLLTLPGGSVAAAGALRQGAPARLVAAESEHVLLRAGLPASDGRRPVEVEVVSGAMAELLRAGPLSPDVVEAFAVRHQTTADEVQELVASLRADGILAP